MNTLDDSIGVDFQRFGGDEIVKVQSAKDRLVFEIMLVVVTIGMTYLLYRMGGYKMVVLNLFYLPIVLSGYFLGRTNAGILALLSVLAVTIATVLDSTGFAGFSSPVTVGLALTVWAGALGLTAILVGTLCDERAKTVEELHAAYVGVVEVLSRYLQSADPQVKARSTRIAELSQAVALEMRLSRKDMDDVRVGALLYDLGNVEITTHILSKAVHTLEAGVGRAGTYTFSGTDLVHSLGSVLSGALPLLLNQDDISREYVNRVAQGQTPGVPIGAKIIRTVRAYDSLLFQPTAGATLTPEKAIRELRMDVASGHDPEILDALERCSRRQARSVAASVLTTAAH
jgi:HD-GYP domain-containing protein (c-di-GMP phosphodiesterase class II)